MSGAVELLRRLSEIGATVNPAGDKLVVRAGARPVPAELVKHLRAAKAEVLAALTPATGGRDAAWWRRELTVRTLVLGERSRGEAERLAFDHLVLEWHRDHGARVPEWQCAGCGKPIGGPEVLALADGNRVHFQALDCLLRYGERWRAAATAALRAFGLHPSEGSEPLLPWELGSDHGG
jgi:hypothetical protein